MCVCCTFFKKLNCWKFNSWPHRAPTHDLKEFVTQVSAAKGNICGICVYEEPVHNGMYLTSGFMRFKSSGVRQGIATDVLNFVRPELKFVCQDLRTGDVQTTHDQSRAKPRFVGIGHYKKNGSKVILYIVCVASFLFLMVLLDHTLYTF